MNWEKKYKELTSGFYKCAEDISDKYPDCTDFEKCVITLRTNGWTYDNIQKKLGMPSKKAISAALKKWAPELINNSKKKEIKISNWESEIYNLVKYKPLMITIDDEDYVFYVKDNKLYYKDWSSDDNQFGNLNEIVQQQFWIAIKEKLDETT